MFRQLLVPLDGSPAAEQALPVARKVALATQATLHLVHVIPLPLPPWAVMGVYLPQSAYDVAVQADEQEAASYLAGVRGRVAATGIQVRVTVLSGSADPQLVLYEREQAIDLVVLSLHPHPGPARLTLGPVAAHLLRYGSAPLLLVGGCADASCLAHAVLPLDGSAAHEEILTTVQALAPAVVQRVSLLRVVQDEGQRPAGERYLADIEQRLALQNLPVVDRRVVVGCPQTTIREMAGNERLVVRATHAHASPLHWLTSSVAERVVHEHVPAVLLVRTGTPANPRLHAVPCGLDDVHEPAEGAAAPAALEG